MEHTKTISNIKEDSLLVWLDNSLQETQNELNSKTFQIGFWRSGEWKNFPSWNDSNETDVNELINESELEITLLSYRLNWIEQQIKTINN
jgi:hypothetical protein